GLCEAGPDSRRLHRAPGKRRMECQAQWKVFLYSQSICHHRVCRGWPVQIWKWFQHRWLAHG
ncbi:hypothetical protein SARC_16478, partial [Sphaeroforma arctica JP610]